MSEPRIMWTEVEDVHTLMCFCDWVGMHRIGDKGAASSDELRAALDGLIDAAEDYRKWPVVSTETHLDMALVSARAALSSKPSEPPLDSHKPRMA